MTVKEAGELVIWLGLVAGALFSIGAFLRVAVVNPLKRNTNKELETVKANVARVLEEVAPQSGVRIGERMNSVDLRLMAVEQRLSDHIRTPHAVIPQQLSATDARQ